MKYKFREHKHKFFISLPPSINFNDMHATQEVHSAREEDRWGSSGVNGSSERINEFLKRGFG